MLEGLLNLLNEFFEKFYDLWRHYDPSGYDPSVFEVPKDEVVKKNPEEELELKRENINITEEGNIVVTYNNAAVTYTIEPVNNNFNNNNVNNNNFNNNNVNNNNVNNNNVNNNNFNNKSIVSSSNNNRNANNINNLNHKKIINVNNLFNIIDDNNKRTINVNNNNNIINDNTTLILSNDCLKTSVVINERNNNFNFNNSVNILLNDKMKVFNTVKTIEILCAMDFINHANHAVLEFKYNELFKLYGHSNPDFTEKYNKFYSSPDYFSLIEYLSTVEYYYPKKKDPILWYDSEGFRNKIVTLENVLSDVAIAISEEVFREGIEDHEYNENSLPGLRQMTTEEIRIMVDFEDRIDQQKLNHEDRLLILIKLLSEFGYNRKGCFLVLKDFHPNLRRKEFRETYSLHKKIEKKNKLEGKPEVKLLKSYLELKEREKEAEEKAKAKAEAEAKSDVIVLKDSDVIVRTIPQEEEVYEEDVNYEYEPSYSGSDYDSDQEQDQSLISKQISKEKNISNKNISNNMDISNENISNMDMDPTLILLSQSKLNVDPYAEKDITFAFDVILDPDKVDEYKKKFGRVVLEKFWVDGTVDLLNFKLEQMDNILTMNDFMLISDHIKKMRKQGFKTRDQRLFLYDCLLSIKLNHYKLCKVAKVFDPFIEVKDIKRYIKTITEMSKKEVNWRQKELKLRVVIELNTPKVYNFIQNCTFVEFHNDEDSFYIINFKKKNTITEANFKRKTIEITNYFGNQGYMMPEIVVIVLHLINNKKDFWQFNDLMYSLLNYLEDNNFRIINNID